MDPKNNDANEPTEIALNIEQMAEHLLQLIDESEDSAEYEEDLPIMLHGEEEEQKEDEEKKAQNEDEEEEEPVSNKYEIPKPRYIDEKDWKWTDGICYTYGEKEEEQLANIMKNMGIDTYKGTKVDRAQTSTTYIRNNSKSDLNEPLIFVKWDEEEDFVCGKPISDKYLKYFKPEEGIKKWGDGDQAKRMADSVKNQTPKNLLTHVGLAMTKFKANADKHIYDGNISGALDEINKYLAKWNKLDEKIEDLEENEENAKTREKFKEAQDLMKTIIEKVKELTLEEGTSRND